MDDELTPEERERADRWLAERDAAYLRAEGDPGWRAALAPVTWTEPDGSEVGGDPARDAEALAALRTAPPVVVALEERDEDGEPDKT